MIVLRRPEKEHDRGSRPRPSPVPLSGPFAVRRRRRPCGAREGAPGVAVLGHGEQGLTENRAWRALRRSRRSPPERCGGIRGGIIPRCVSGRSRVWVGRGFLPARLLADDWRNGGIKRNRGIKTKSEQGRCHRAWRDPWRPATPSWRAATPSQTLSSRHKTLSVSLCTQDPLCLSPEDDLRPPTRERPCSRRLGANPGPVRFSSSQGRTRGVFLFTGETLVPEVGREPRARAFLPSQGRTRGVLRRGESAIPPSVDRPSR